MTDEERERNSARSAMIEESARDIHNQRQHIVNLYGQLHDARRLRDTVGAEICEEEIEEAESELQEMIEYHDGLADSVAF